MFDPPSRGQEKLSSQTTPRLLVGIMPSRLVDLQQTVEGYERSKNILVAFDGEHFLIAGFSDDPGLYYFVPVFSRILQTNVAQTFAICYLSILAFAYIAGAIGLALILSGPLSRITAAAWLLIVAVVVYKIGDLYLLEFALPAVLVPWTLWWVRGHAEKWWVGFAIFVFAAGVLISTAQFIRLTSGPPAFAFVVLLITLCLRVSRAKKLVALGLLLAGSLVSHAYFHYLVSHRDAFLASHSPGFQTGFRRHHFWHSAHIGLGFLSNGYVQGSCDDFNKDLVRSIDPTAVYLSGEYDQILKQRTLSVIKRHPLLVTFTVAAKLGIIAAVVIVFANVGLLLLKRRALPCRLQLAFWAALAISALPLLIFVPLKLYLVSVISYAALLGILAACSPKPVCTPSLGP